jgi:outer membrane lipoprotein carrier protein
MKNTLMFVLILSILSTVLFAQDEKLIDSLKRIDTLKAEFKQTTTIVGVGEDNYSGILYLKKGDKILWDYNSPHKQFYLFTKDDLSYYDSITKQLVRQKAENLGVENIVFRLLMEPLEIKNTFFIIIMDKDIFKLYPKENMGLQYMEITLEDDLIKKIVSRDEQGNTTEITLYNISMNKPLDKNIFNVNVPEGTEVFTY